MELQALAVFCGYRDGSDPAYVEAAIKLGSALVERDITLVYGGGAFGMMGALANTVLEGGGRAVGVIPGFLMERGQGHPGLKEVHVVDSLHERKARMAELSDGFLVLPGGLGTLDELFEALTSMQLGVHDKPIGLVNTKGYYDPLIAFMDRALAQEFMTRDHHDLLMMDREVSAVLDAMSERLAGLDSEIVRPRLV
ncbi:MAG: TIGR00730 family Rossman fold protein [Pseudomonadales bacterium]